MITFWQTWRKDILRGGTLFACVLGLGLMAHLMVHRVRDRVVSNLPEALKQIREMRGNFDPDLSAGAKPVGDRWVFRDRLAPKQWVWIHNTSGTITVGPGRGDSLDVAAVQVSRSGSPARVRIVTEPYDGGVAICAVREGQDTKCGPGPDADLGAAHGRGLDVAVEFTVHVPRGVHVGATTVNGGIHVAGVSAPVVAKTVNGDVDVETRAGPVTAQSINGSVHARMRSFADTGAVSLTTVNGSVTAELPARLNADIDASAVAGTVSSDYALGMTNTFMQHKLTGTLGHGGRAVKLSTVTGSIHLMKAAAYEPPK